MSHPPPKDIISPFSPLADHLTDLKSPRLSDWLVEAVSQQIQLQKITGFFSVMTVCKGKSRNLPALTSDLSGSEGVKDNF